MEIRKRNGESVPFQQEKIFNAMKKAFDGQGKEIGSREMDEILATVLNNLSVTVPLTVERVQDEVERTLMERGHYEVAKAYILYREKRSALRRVRHTIARTVGVTLFNAKIAEGLPQKLEHNDIKWIAPSEIFNYDFCPADKEILKRILEVYNG